MHGLTERGCHKEHGGKECWELCSETIKDMSELSVLLVGIAYLKARKGIHMEQSFCPLPADEISEGGRQILGGQWYPKDFLNSPCHYIPPTPPQLSKKLALKGWGHPPG